MILEILKRPTESSSSHYVWTKVCSAYVDKVTYNDQGQMIVEGRTIHIINVRDYLHKATAIPTYMAQNGQLASLQFRVPPNHLVEVEA